MDEKVNRERTAFDIEDNEKSLFSDITKNDIISEASKLLLPYLDTDIEAYNKNKKEKIEKFVFNKNPRYRLLLSKYPECINNILISDDE